ncbi:MAG: RHS repeat-associated core domain-containing protein, partial [Phycisphaerales bacterium]
LLTDHLGSTSTTANEDGSWNSTIKYTAFGCPCAARRVLRNTRETSGVTPTKYRYTGQLLEAEVGLYYYVARWYDPAIMHFVQADTMVPNIANSASYDRYAYVMNNPVRYSDPSGHACREDGFCVLQQGEKVSNSTKNSQVKVVKYSGVDKPILLISREQYKQNLRDSAINNAIANQNSNQLDNRCAPFISEMINRAGLQTNEKWNPSSYAWMRVLDQLNYFAGTTDIKSLNKLYSNGQWDYEMLKKVKPGDLVFFYTNVDYGGLNGDSILDGSIDPMHVAMISGFGEQTNYSTSTFMKIDDGKSQGVPLIVDQSSNAQYLQGLNDENISPRSIDDIGDTTTMIIWVSMEDFY